MERFELRHFNINFLIQILHKIHRSAIYQLFIKTIVEERNYCGECTKERWLNEKKKRKENCPHRMIG